MKGRGYEVRCAAVACIAALLLLTIPGGAFAKSLYVGHHEYRHFDAWNINPDGTGVHP